MQKLSSFFGRLALTVAGALALGACNRAEYAMLPQSASYLGTKAVAARPAVPATQPAAPEAAVTAPPVAAVAPPSIAAPEPLVAVAPKPAGRATAQRPALTVTTPTAVQAEVATAPAKPTLAQRLALKKISSKLDKLAAKSPQFKQRDASAQTARISGNLRTGIILLIIGLLVGLLNGLIGTIIAIIGLVFILLWLLDEL